MSDPTATVLVTSAGAECSPGKIATLRRAGYRVVAVDADPYADGLYLADSAHAVPAGGDPRFTGAIADICATEQVQVIVPLADEEMVPLWELSRKGVSVLAPRLDIVRMCLDKLRLMEVLQGSAVRVPRTRLASQEVTGLKYPLVLKPRVGQGGRGIVRVENESLLGRVLHERAGALDSYVLQEFIGGAEYSVSVVVWRDRRVQAVVPQQVAREAGYPSLATTRRNPGLEELCIEAAHALDADGPLNVQARTDASGTPYVLEIKPGLSRSSILTVAAGVDEISGLVAQALEQDGSALKNGWREGVVMLRHPMESFFEERAFAERHAALRKSG